MKRHLSAWGISGAPLYVSEPFSFAVMFYNPRNNTIFAHQYAVEIFQGPTISGSLESLYWSMRGDRPQSQTYRKEVLDKKKLLHRCVRWDLQHLSHHVQPQQSRPEGAGGGDAGASAKVYSQLLSSPQGHLQGQAPPGFPLLAKIVTKLHVLEFRPHIGNPTVSAQSMQVWF